MGETGSWGPLSHSEAPIGTDEDSQAENGSADGKLTDPSLLAAAPAPST